MRATKGPADWQSLLGDPSRQWRAGFSAMATAQSWEAGFPPEVAALCGDGADLQLAIAEHQVALPGRGAPSQCDVFALVHAAGRDMAVAIEAKVAEPFGPTVTEWLGAEPSTNRQERLAELSAWLGLGPLQGDLRYQLLHRTAAAIAEARRFRRPVAALIVQSFSPERAWFADFAAFVSALGLTVEPDRAVETILPDGLALRLGWASGDARWLKPIAGQKQSAGPSGAPAGGHVKP
nr:hypothetical protein [Thetidibacter halocola]